MEGDRALIGSIDVSLGTGPYVVCVSRGHVTFAMSVGAQAELDRLYAAHPACDSILYDGIGLESIESGLPIRWIKWALSRPRKSRRVAFVGTLRSGIAITTTFRYLLPRLRYGVFGDRASALAFLLGASDVERRPR